MKILVTGGCGFIGSAFIRRLLGSDGPGDIQVVNLDKLTYAGCQENLVSASQDPNYTFIERDICDAAGVNEALVDGCDQIVHFAAESHVDRSNFDASDFIYTNIVGTYNMLELAKRHQVRRFLYVSTDEVQGSLGSGEFFTEDMPLDPTNLYAACKASGELLARSYYKVHGLDVVVTRGSNTFGPYQYPEKLFPVLITRAFKDQPLPIYGEGTNERDWIYVDDTASAIQTVLEKGVAGEVYGLGSRAVRSNIQIARLILRLTGKPESQLEFVTDRLAHDQRYATDPSKLYALGWQPRFSFDDGVRATVAWYLAEQNQSWIKTALQRSKEFFQRNYSDR